MTEFSLKLSDDTRQQTLDTIASFGERIKILGQSDRRVKIKTDQVAADELAVKTGIDVHPVVYADIDMGMRNTMMRTMQELAESLKKADAAILLAKSNPVDPVDGQPAVRYMARTEDFMAVTSSYQLKAELERSGLRIHSTGIEALSVIFFDAADPTKVNAITMPDGWTLQKLGAPSP